jgi:hypothetical protein
MDASIFFTAAMIRAFMQSVPLGNYPCLKARIIAAVTNFDALTLTRVWQQLEYRIDVCRAMHTSKIFSCQKKKTFSGFLWL